MRLAFVVVRCFNTASMQVPTGPDAVRPSMTALFKRELFLLIPYPEEKRNEAFIRLLELVVSKLPTLSFLAILHPIFMSNQAARPGAQLVHHNPHNNL